MIDNRLMARKVVELMSALKEELGVDDVTFIIVVKKGDRMVECSRGEWVRDLRVGLDRVASGEAG